MMSTPFFAYPATMFCDPLPFLKPVYTSAKRALDFEWRKTDRPLIVIVRKSSTSASWASLSQGASLVQSSSLMMEKSRSQGNERGRRRSIQSCTGPELQLSLSSTKGELDSVKVTSSSSKSIELPKSKSLSYYSCLAWSLHQARIEPIISS